MSSEQDRAVRTKATSRLEGTLAVQAGQTIFVTVGRAVDVIRQNKVDIYNSMTDSGYQREPSPIRVKRASQYYAEGGRMPNPLLVNIRESDMASVNIAIPKGAEEFESAQREGTNWIGAATLEFSVDVPLWVYDGQHRAGGIERLLELDKFLSFPVPLTITLGLDTAEEMKEFYEVNTNAKADRTDLAEQLLKKMASEDPELAALLELKGRDWKIRGIEVVEEIMGMEGPWEDSIQRPNQKRHRLDRITISQAQFVSSLKPVLTLPLLAKAEPRDIASIINAFWKGISIVMPEPFSDEKSPKDFVLQKGAGTVSLHRLLPQIMEVVRAKGARLADPKAYAEVMKRLPEVEGEAFDEDGTSRIVNGAEFWISGPTGVASGFTGDAGRKRLAIMLQSFIPRPTEELKL